uniref:Protein kinase domain-containing protein n=1 Tax=Amphiprion ocellaris TaxID=80972 RepID=A0AAQ5YR42_AMPOC
MSHFTVKEDEILTAESGQYQILKSLGKGSFATVAKCKKLTTEEVAVKFIRDDMSFAGRREIQMYKKLKELDPDKCNVVRFIEHFTVNNHVCLAFELLGDSIHDVMIKRNFKPFRVSEIRVVAQQLLVSLNALKSIGLVHADIKPDNIMLVNHKAQPLKVKLIDFGMAHMSSNFNNYKIQAIGYRAPEVILGLPLNEAVDMWTLGTVLAFMYTGKHLYPTHSNYEAIRVMVQMQGQPEERVLDSAKYAESYFTKSNSSPCDMWRLNTSTEYTKITGIATERRKLKDTLAFISLLKRMLHMDPTKRITPTQALGHRFITMKHLSHGASNSANISAAQTTGCQMNEAPVERYVTSTETVSSSDGRKEFVSVESKVPSDYVPVKSKHKYFRAIGKFFSSIKSSNKTHFLIVTSGENSSSVSHQSPKYFPDAQHFC